MLLLIVLAALFQQPSVGKEHFYEYIPEGGSGIWGTSPQCDDTAINLQEDLQNPGRYWGWLNNSQQSCAFYNFGGGGGGGTIELYKQCGGKGGSCQQDGQCVDAPWSGKSCKSGSCKRANEWHHQCEPGDGGADPAPVPTAGRQGGSSITYNAQCGGNSGSCGNGLPCVDSPWPNEQCAPESTCVRENAGMWTCKRN